MEVILSRTLAELISPLAELISPLAELIPALAELIPAAWDVCCIPPYRAGGPSGLGCFGLDSEFHVLCAVLSSTLGVVTFRSRSRRRRTAMSV